MQPGALEEEIPPPLSRHSKWHPTPTLSGNQEKFINVNFDVKINEKREYTQLDVQTEQRHIDHEASLNMLQILYQVSTALDWPL
jgi:protein associated with RNAse G/E